MNRLFVIFCIVISTWACQSEVKKSGHFRRANTPDEHGEQIAVVYTDSGELRAKLFAQVIDHYRTYPKDPYLEMKKGLQVYFYNKDKVNPESMLKANYGIKYEKSKKIVLKNDVMLVNTDHDTLNTELLIWNEATRKIYSDKFVRIKKPKEILYGYGFESNEDFSNYKIFKISGSITRENGKNN